MHLTNPTAEIFVPDGCALPGALERTTALGIGAHQDDLEILAYHGILECFGLDDAWFTGVVMTNGSGSARDHLYAAYSDADMQKVRRREQNKAAVVGEYAAVLQLDYSSATMKAAESAGPVADLQAILKATRPKVVYTHNLADKHDTHVAVVLRLIQAIRLLPPEQRPEKVLGCEVWRDLDWACDSDKVALNVDQHENLAAALVGIFDSQIVGGKRYDLATTGRRRAHATYSSSHATDTCTGLTFALDLTPLIHDLDIEPKDYISTFIDRFANDVKSRIDKLS